MFRKKRQSCLNGRLFQKRHSHMGGKSKSMGKVCRDKIRFLNCIHEKFL